MSEWNKQKGESSLWYGRFEAYRMLGPGRSLLGTYNNDLAEKGVERRNSIPSSWQKACERFRWKVRAESWDAHERKKEREEDEEIRQRVRASRKKLIEDGLQQMADALWTLDLKEAKMGEVVKGIKVLSDQSRLEFGDNTVATPISHKILEALIAGETSVREAALRYNQEGLAIPKAVEIMLAKEPPEEPEDDEYTMPSEEELEERGRKAKEEYDRQIGAFVPKRKAEVEEIKAELADHDSFAEEKIEEALT